MKGTFLESRIDDKQGGIASKLKNVDSSIGHIYPLFLICCEIRYGIDIESRLTPTNKSEISYFAHGLLMTNVKARLSDSSFGPAGHCH